MSPMYQVLFPPGIEAKRVTKTDMIPAVMEITF